MENQVLKTDVVIIGSGPVGLFAIFECGMLGLKCHVVDALPEIGGQCIALYPEKPIYDIPGYPSILAGDLIASLEKQAAPFDPVFHLDQMVTHIEKQDGVWNLQTSKGTKFRSAAIIIAAGAGAFGPNRPPLDDIESYEGQSVFYMVKRRDDFKDKRVVIAGGGDSAVDWANALADVAKSVHVVHRRDKFRAAPESVKQMEGHSKIEKIIPAQLKALEGRNGQISAVILDDMNGGERKVEADCLLPFFGLATSLGPIAQWGLGVENNTIKTEPTTSATNIEGIYAIGDIAQYPHKLKLILTGFGEAAAAAHDIWRGLNPDQQLHMEYSTTKGLPD